MTPDSILQAVDLTELAASRIPSGGVAKTVFRSTRLLQLEAPDSRHRAYNTADTAAALLASIIKSDNTGRSLAEIRVVPSNLDLLKSLRIDGRGKNPHTLRKTNIEAFYLWHLAHLEDGE